MSRPGSKDTSEPSKYKITVLGKVCSGKTELIQRIVSSPDTPFRDRYKQTIGVDFARLVISAKTPAEYALEIWDVSGDQGGSHMLRVYCKSTQIFVLTVDLTNVNDSLKQYFEGSTAQYFGCEIRDHFARLETEENRPQCIVVYTKSDAPDATIPTPEEQRQHRKDLANGIGIHEDDIKESFITSAKDYTGIRETVKGISSLLRPSLPSDSFVFDLSGGAGASSASGGAVSAGLFSRMLGGSSSNTTSNLNDAEKLGIEPTF